MAGEVLTHVIMFLLVIDLTLDDCEEGVEVYSSIQKGHETNSSLISLEFTCPVQTTHFSASLAKEGFCYTGQVVQVRCYFCGLEYQNWKRNDNIREIHQTLSKHCNSMQSIECYNATTHFTEENRKHSNALESVLLTDGSVLIDCIHSSDLELTLYSISYISMKIVSYIILIVHLFVILAKVSVNVKFSHKRKNNEVLSTKHFQDYKSNAVDINKVVPEIRSRPRSKHLSHTYSFIFEFPKIIQHQSSVYPASLEQYFKDVLSSNSEFSEKYKYEWARYASFKDFPDSAPVMPLTLAKEGFYYTGQGVQVRCYFCGLVYQNWNRNDNIREIHQTLSKHCKIVTGNETNNISISNIESDSCSQKSERACGYSTDVIKSKSNQPHINDDVTSRCCINDNQTFVHDYLSPKKVDNLIKDGDRYHKKKDNESASVEADALHTENAGNRSIGEHVIGKQTNETVLAAGKVSAGYSGGHKDLPNFAEDITEIFKTQAKHPQYALEAVRLSSYTKWPSAVEQTPQQMCDAGFFYGGFSDCVRCFFCGGGLRNWAYGDSPWVEHARWYPKCQFVRHHKGKQFMETYQQGNGMTISSHETIAAEPKQPNPKDNESLEDEKWGTKGKYWTNEQQEPGRNECGKSKLSKKAQSLATENRQLKDQMICKLCMKREVCIVFLPCGHMVSCQTCAGTVQNCCVCRTIVKGTLKAYF